MLIASRTFELKRHPMPTTERWWWWWYVVQTPGQPRERTMLCNPILRKLFKLPKDLKVLTISLYTKPAPQRIKVQLSVEHWCQLQVTEEGVPRSSDYCVEASREDIPEVVKSKRKIFYAEVTWEE